MPTAPQASAAWDSTQTIDPRVRGPARASQAVPRNAALAVDLGEVNDFTALCLIHQVGDKFDCAHLSRAPKGTPYRNVIAYVKQLMALPECEDVDLVVDATGVGRPVVEQMQDEGLSPIPLVVTGGVNEIHEPYDWSWRVPKKNLVTVAQICLGSGRLRLPKGHELMQTVEQELRTFKRKTNPQTMNDSFEAGRESVNDDCVFALCAALWWTSKYYEPVQKTLADALHRDDWLTRVQMQDYEDFQRRQMQGPDEIALEDWIERRGDEWN